MPYHLAMSPYFCRRRTVPALTTRDSLPDSGGFVNPFFEKSLSQGKQLWEGEKSGILYPKHLKEDAKMEQKRSSISPMDRGGMRRTFSSKKFEAKYTDLTRPLGALFTPQQTLFRVWAPTASEVTLLLYPTGDPAGEPVQRRKMEPEDKGFYSTLLSGNLAGVYYAFEVKVADTTLFAVDPYAKSVGVNGWRGMVLDPVSANPPGWEEDAPLAAVTRPTDAVVYEIHIQDFSSDPASGIRQKGRYLGLSEGGTVTPFGEATGLDYLEQLGVTHVQLMPVYDFSSVDEETGGYNWGYDPQNYFAPEGSYATDPYDGRIRVRELKQAILALHQRGIGVVMDVVFNHVADSEAFSFNRLVPGYFSRIRKVKGKKVYSNGSWCGNDTASERSMVRRYLVDCCEYWAKEYHLDGFRFDIVSLLDTETVNAIMARVKQVNPCCLFYGEGWKVDSDVTKKEAVLAGQETSALTPGFGFFNDTLRDGVRGSLFDASAGGWLAGKEEFVPQLKDCIRGNAWWCPQPDQAINFVSCHDNLTLWGKLAQVFSDRSPEFLRAANRLAAAMVFFSQGMPFLLGGEELFLAKEDGNGGYDPNSYNVTDGRNRIPWSSLSQPEVRQNRDFYRDLIAFRKAHPLLRLGSKQQIDAALTFLDTEGCLIAFTLSDPAVEPGKLLVALNPDPAPVKLSGFDRCRVLLCQGWKQSKEATLTVPGLGFVAAEVG